MQAAAFIDDDEAQDPGANPTDLTEQICQTSLANTEFPPLNSIQYLKVERGNEKRRHTNLLKKIVACIQDRGARSRIKVYRENLTEQLVECGKAHDKFVNHPDYDPDTDAVKDQYIKDIEKEATRGYSMIDLYLSTTKSQSSVLSSTQRSILSQPILQQFLEHQQPNQESSIGPSASAVVHLATGQQTESNDNDEAWLYTLEKTHDNLRKEMLQQRKKVSEIYDLKMIKLQTQQDSEQLKKQVDNLEKLLREQHDINFHRERKQHEMLETMMKTIEAQNSQIKNQHDNMMQRVDKKMSDMSIKIDNGALSESHVFIRFNFFQT